MVASLAGEVALSDDSGRSLGTSAPGTDTKASRSDHVHPPSGAATTATAGLMSGADKTKLDGVEASATADQTNAEIRDALTGLSGSARLPATAVKDLPAGSLVGLSDTPASFSGQSGKILKVNSGESAVEWADDSAGAPGDITGVTAGSGLSGGGDSGVVTLDVDQPLPAPSAGDSGKIAAVNAGESGYELVDQPVVGGGGDITGVTAGSGLSGGGDSGEVTLDVDQPLPAPSAGDSGKVAAINTGESGYELVDQTVVTNPLPVPMDTPSSSDAGKITEYDANQTRIVWVAKPAGGGTTTNTYYQLEPDPVDSDSDIPSSPTDTDSIMATSAIASLTATFVDAGGAAVTSLAIGDVAVWDATNSQWVVKGNIRGPAGQDGTPGTNASVVLSDTDPSGPGTADSGTSGEVSRADHVHPAQAIPSVPALSSAVPQAPTDAGSSGSGTTSSRGDHAHPKELSDGSVDTAQLADDAVSLAKMEGGTAGKVIGFDASGDPAELDAGSVVDDEPDVVLSAVNTSFVTMISGTLVTGMGGATATADYNGIINAESANIENFYFPPVGIAEIHILAGAEGRVVVVGVATKILSQYVSPTSCRWATGSIACGRARARRTPSGRSRRRSRLRSGRCTPRSGMWWRSSRRSCPAVIESGGTSPVTRRWWGLRTRTTWRCMRTTPG